MAYPTPGSKVVRDENNYVSGGTGSGSNVVKKEEDVKEVGAKKDDIRGKGISKDKVVDNYIEGVRGISPEIELVCMANGIDVNMGIRCERERVLKARELLQAAINLELMGACLLAGVDIPDELSQGGLIKYTYLVDGDKKTMHLSVLVSCVEALNKVVNTNACDILIRGLRKYYPEVNAVQVMSLGEMVALADEYMGKRFTGELIDLSPETEIINRIFKRELENEIWSLTLTNDIEPIDFKVLELDYFNEIGLMCIYVNSLEAAHNINSRINEQGFFDIVSNYIPQVSAVIITYKRLNVIM